MDNQPAPYAPVPPQQPYYAPPAAPAPLRRLNTKRGLVKFILLSIITLGIYSIVFWTGIGSDLNTLAGRWDGKKTMHYCLLFFLLGPITCGIGYLVWYHKVSGRMGSELKRRNIPYSFGAVDFWIFEILLSFTVVCPLIYIHKAAKASKLLAESYNAVG